MRKTTTTTKKTTIRIINDNINTCGTDENDNGLKNSKEWKMIGRLCNETSMINDLCSEMTLMIINITLKVNS